jgi:hypothetical protein
MHAVNHSSSHPFLAALLAGLLITLAGCGGGGGGGVSTAGSSLTAANGDVSGGAASGLGAGAASGLGTGASAGPTSTSSDPAPSDAGQPSTPAAEVRYTMGPVTVANTTTENYQTIEGIAATPDGGYRIIWMTATFDANNNLQRTYFEQRYDASGQRFGGETTIPAPTEDLSPSRASQFATLGGGALRFEFTNQLRPGLNVQHVSAAGDPLDPPIVLGAASHGWSHAGLPLADGSLAIAWQAVSSVGPGEIQTALLTPGPR